ncbi:MAG: ArnT family glycosyltransferase [Armatimonadota bacterium]
MKGDTRRLVLIVCGALMLFTYGLGTPTLWDQDEALYTDIARQIADGGDPFTLQSNGRPWFVHPPLFMWLQAMTGRLFGFTEFTARIWSAIAATAAVAVTFLLARLLYDARTGLLAAAVLATTMQFLGQARLAIFDPLLLVFVLLALYMYLVAYTTGSRRAHLWAWMWAGWATATKGPIGLLLPGMVVVALWIVRRDWSRWRDIPALGPAIFAVVGLPWYLIEIARHGQEFVQAALGYYLVNRFFGVVENQPGPWWYYVPVLLAGAFPWTAYLPPAVVYHARRRDHLASQVILLWVGITVVFYSIAGTKLPNYLLPVYPLIAIGVARLALDALDRRTADAPRLMRWAFALLLVGLAVFISTALVFGRVEYPAQLAALRSAVALIVAIFVAGSIASLATYVLGRPALAVGALVATVVVALPVLVHHTLPAVEAQRPLPRVARVLAGRMRPGDALGAVRMHTNASLMYYARHPVLWIETPHQLGQALCRHDRIFLVVPEAHYRAWVEPLLPAAVVERARDGDYRILAKADRMPCAGAWPAL